MSLLTPGSPEVSSHEREPDVNALGISWESRAELAGGPSRLLAGSSSWHTTTRSYLRHVTGRRSSLLHAMFGRQTEDVGRILASAETYSEHFDVADPLHLLIEWKIVLKRQLGFGVVERHEVGADTSRIERAFLVTCAPFAAEIR